MKVCPINEYLRIAREQRPGKWRDIKLSNIAASMSPPDLERLRELCLKQETEGLTAFIAKLEELKAPAVVLDLQRSRVGKEPASVAIIRRRLAKITSPVL